MTVDPDKLKLYSFQLFTKLEGAVTAGMVHLGDQLGLYAAMKSAGAPLTTTELAAASRLARAMGARVGVQPGGGQADRGRRRSERFSLSPEAAAVLADTGPSGVRHGHVPSLAGDDAALDRVSESFVTGLGHDYDSHGPEGAVGIERSFEPWNNAFLLPDRAAGARRRRRPADRGRTRRRHRLWRRECGAADGRGVPEVDVRRLRHLPATRSIAPSEKQAAAGVDQRQLPRPARSIRCRRTTPSTW